MTSVANKKAVVKHSGALNDAFRRWIAPGIWPKITTDYPDFTNFLLFYRVIREICG
jgi:hypothetical protein